MSSRHRRAREAEEARARSPKCELASTVTGAPCTQPTKRLCATCGRRACAAHGRYPWGGPYLCCECEAANGSPPRPAEFPDRHVPGLPSRAHPDRKVAGVEVIVRRRGDP